MSPTKLTNDQIDAATSFHGHSCPGLTIGLRAAELALSEIGPHAADEELVCLTETDMCAVDAIQFLTGCTFGKGNLIYKDNGKIAFSFWRRSDAKGVRLLFAPPKVDDPEAAELKKKQATVGLSADEQARMKQKRQEHIQQLLSADLEDLFAIQPLSSKPPVKARLMASLICEACGESTMESRTRNFMGQLLCTPCFDKVDAR
jgi:formylmethanofuran dehydrogenase subunit E